MMGFSTRTRDNILTDGFMKFPSERQTKLNQTQGWSYSTARWHTEGTFTDIKFVKATLFVKFLGGRVLTFSSHKLICNKTTKENWLLFTLHTFLVLFSVVLLFSVIPEKMWVLIFHLSGKTLLQLRATLTFIWHDFNLHIFYVKYLGMMPK